MDIANPQTLAVINVILHNWNSALYETCYLMQNHDSPGYVHPSGYFLCPLAVWFRHLCPVSFTADLD